MRIENKFRGLHGLIYPFKVILILSPESIMSIGRRKEFQSWRFERYPFIIALTEGWSSKRQLWNSLRWPNYIFNSVDKTKLSYFKVQLIFLYPPLTQQHRFFKILPSLNIQGLEASMHKLSTPTHICEQNSIGKNPLKNRWSNMFKCSRVSVRNMNYGTTSHSWQFTCTF